MVAPLRGFGNGGVPRPRVETRGYRGCAAARLWKRGVPKPRVETRGYRGCVAARLWVRVVPLCGWRIGVLNY